MIVLNKKRILLTLAVSLIAIFTFLIQTASTKENNKTVQTVALPVSDKVIVIDAGHGVPDEGAQSSTRNNRGRNKLKNCSKTANTFRAVRKDCNFNKK